jgi:hypothetical protein
MGERHQLAIEQVKRLLSERVRFSLPTKAAGGDSDWRFGSKSVEQAKMRSIAPFDVLHLRWRLVETKAPALHEPDLWALAGHAYWADRKIVYRGTYLRHPRSGAFLSFELDLVVSNHS